MEEWHCSPPFPADATRPSAGRQRGADQVLEPGLVVAQQDVGLVRPAALAAPVHHQCAAGVCALQFDRQWPLGQLQRTLRGEHEGHRQRVGREPVVAPAVGRPQPGLLGDAGVEPGPLAVGGQPCVDLAVRQAVGDGGFPVGQSVASERLQRDVGRFGVEV